MEGPTYKKLSFIIIIIIIIIILLYYNNNSRNVHRNFHFFKFIDIFPDHQEIFLKL